jgi:hypothetical protein
MLRFSNDRVPKSLFLVIFLILSISLTFANTAMKSDRVETKRDSEGWKLQVNGEDYFVKGIVWGYTPIGENYSYNLWANSDDFVMKVLDYECKLMQAAGINTIRSFGMIPPKWVTYIYNKYGIMTIINHLMGRYGYNVGGVWIPKTNYADELTRYTLKKDFVALVEQYKDVPGVLMFALGNESNYGLEWSSFEIENLPVGERHKEKAKSLYSLFNEVVVEAKRVDSKHVYTIVNGDIQYLDLIVEYCDDIDILGVNAYRGISFTDMWYRVDKELDYPVMLTEFGSDAFNALSFEEDQAGQAHIVKGNWVEIYNKSHGKGEEGNAIGGCLFEWRDEWWKYLQVENLTVQDNNASWSNGGYSFDYRNGVNNMNEEWFGICGLSYPNEDGVYEAVPRAAYDVMKAVWKVDPYDVNKEEMNNYFDNLNMQLYTLSGTVTQFKAENKLAKYIQLKGGSLKGDLIFNGKANDVEEDGKNGLDFSNGEMINLDFAFQPTSRINGEFTLNILGNVVDKQLEEYYGKRGLSYTSITGELNDNDLPVMSTKKVKDNERLEIYSFKATYRGDNYDLTSFYHIPRYHWQYDGDFFGLLYEATDMDGMDIWDAKAPYGIEFEGKRAFEGLTILAGPEVYWGANPKAIAKYNFATDRFKYTVMHAEDFAEAEADATDTEATTEATRQTAISLETTYIPRTKIQLGYLMAGSEKIDDEFYYVEGTDLYQDKIELEDTQAFKAKITIDAPWAIKFDTSFNYAGLVANAGEPLREFDTEMPYSALGNKMVYEAGLIIPVGNFFFLPRAMYRENLIDANPYMEATTNGVELFPGVAPRNLENDPFAVLDNREAKSGEFFFSYDPTPASSFYAWDYERKEDAKLAFSLGGVYTKYETETDANLFYYQEGEINAPFASGLSAEEVWLGKLKLVMNPNPNLKMIANVSLGKQQSSGTPEGDLAEFAELSTKFILAKRHYIESYIKKDAWGPLDWYRQFNITFPYQYMLDYSFLMDSLFSEEASSRIGFRGLLRELNNDSPINEASDDPHDYEFQAGIYYRFEF